MEGATGGQCAALGPPGNAPAWRKQECRCCWSSLAACRTRTRRSSRSSSTQCQSGRRYASTAPALVWEALVWAVRGDGFICMRSTRTVHTHRAQLLDWTCRLPSLPAEAGRRVLAALMPLVPLGAEFGRHLLLLLRKLLSHLRHVHAPWRCTGSVGCSRAASYPRSQARNQMQCWRCAGMLDGPEPAGPHV